MGFFWQKKKPEVKVEDVVATEKRQAPITRPTGAKQRRVPTRLAQTKNKKRNNNRTKKSKEKQSASKAPKNDVPKPSDMETSTDKNKMQTTKPDISGLGGVGLPGLVPQLGAPVRAKPAQDVSEKEAPENTVSHIWEDEKLSGPQYCEICKEFIWGMDIRAYKCKLCKNIVHQKCGDKLSRGCIGISSEDDSKENKSEVALVDENEKTSEAPVQEEKEVPKNQQNVNVPHLDDLRVDLDDVERDCTVSELKEKVAEDGEFKARNGNVEDHGIFLVLSDSTGRGLWLDDTSTLKSYGITADDTLLLKNRKLNYIIKVLVSPNFVTRGFRYNDTMTVGELMDQVFERDLVVHSELYGLYRTNSSPAAAEKKENGKDSDGDEAAAEIDQDCMQREQLLIDFGFSGIETLELKPMPADDSDFAIVEVLIPSLPRRALVPVEDPSITTVNDVIDELVRDHCSPNEDEAAGEGAGASIEAEDESDNEDKVKEREWLLWTKSDSPLPGDAILESLDFGTDHSLGEDWDYGYGSGEPKLWLRKVSEAQSASEEPAGKGKGKEAEVESKEEKKRLKEEQKKKKDEEKAKLKEEKKKRDEEKAKAKEAEKERKEEEKKKRDEEKRKEKEEKQKQKDEEKLRKEEEKTKAKEEEEQKEKAKSDDKAEKKEEKEESTPGPGPESISKKGEGEDEGECEIKKPKPTPVEVEPVAEKEEEKKEETKMKTDELDAIEADLDDIMASLNDI